MTIDERLVEGYDHFQGFLSNHNTVVRFGHRKDGIRSYYVRNFIQGF
jgi:hypothetical protein